MRALFVAATIAIIAPYAHAGVEDDLREGDKAFDDQNWKKAAASYDRAIASAPGQISAEAYGNRARIFIIQQDYKGGLAFVQRAKAQHPNAPEVLEQEALMLWETDRKPDAIQVAEKVVKARPQTFSNQKLIGDFYYGRDWVKTASAYEGYLQYRPGDLEKADAIPRIKLGFAYLQNGRSVLNDGDEARAKQFYEKAGEQFEIVRRKHNKAPGAQANAENGLCAVYSGLQRWDQAINVCDHVLQETKRVDSAGSVYYNLALAYLARKQTKKARERANDFARVRKNEARGFMLIGDTFFEERDWQNALDQYLRAEKALKPNQTREGVQLSIKLGKTYRRLPAPQGANNPYLANAIQKLSAAQQQNPNSIELTIELGGAYLEAQKDKEAALLTDRMLAAPELAKATAAQKAELLLVSGKSLFNQKKLKEARARFEEARGIRSSDIGVQKALVTVINEQAYAEGKDYQAAEALYREALKVDPQSPTTLRNIAVLNIERGDCETALKQLQILNGVRARDAVLTQRLIGRSYLCLSKPDAKRADAAFKAAEGEAKRVNAQLSLAEIYTEWAPLTWEADLQTAIERLEFAYQVSAQDPEIGPAAKRNLALARYRRGWNYMRQGKAAEATADFDFASRDAKVLKGVEPDAFEFSLALAQLEAGRGQDAVRTFKQLAAKGNQGSYLKGAWAKVGGEFFVAYANYKSSSGAQRQAACQQLAGFAGTIGSKAKELVATCWESVAADHWRAGQVGAAQKAITEADKFAIGDQQRRLRNDRVVANGLGRGSLQELEALGGNPAESLVNLGIVYDILDRPRDAYDAWNRAKAKGVNVRDLQKWIDAKKRIYGY